MWRMVRGDGTCQPAPPNLRRQGGHQRTKASRAKRLPLLCRSCGRYKVWICSAAPLLSLRGRRWMMGLYFANSLMSLYSYTKKPSSFFLAAATIAFATSLASIGLYFEGRRKENAFIKGVPIFSPILNSFRLPTSMDGRMI